MLVSDIHTLLYVQAGRHEGARMGLQVHSRDRPVHALLLRRARTTPPCIRAG
jgi:hypothetical protein